MPRPIHAVLTGSALVYLVVWTVIVALTPHDGGRSSDDLGYWLTRSGPLYDIPWNTRPEAYVYSPAFAQAIRPLTALLPFAAFHALGVLLQVGVLVRLTGPLIAAALLLVWAPLSLVNIWAGNIYLLLGAAIWYGRRWPALWAFVLLTKVTPGIGLVWHAARREWRELGIAVGVTAAIAAVSFMLWPAAWWEWADFLALNAGASRGIVPLFARLPVAAAIVALGALRGWWWTVPVGAVLASPNLALSATPMLVGLVPYLAERLRSPVAAPQPIGRRPRWLSREEFVRRVMPRQEDPALLRDLRALAPHTHDDLSHR